MKVAVFSAHKFETSYLEIANANRHQLKLINGPLNVETAELAMGCEAVSVFVNDDCSAATLERLQTLGIRFLALRSAGFNHVNIKKAQELKIRVARVPEYSPYAVAEHTIALMLALNRKLIRANNRVGEQNYSLDGLVGFDMHGKTVGIIGTGKIGSVMARILFGFGCKLLAHDAMPNEILANQYNVVYTDLQTICKQSDIITLHLPLSKESKYIINEECILEMKAGVMLINTSRGGLVNTKAVINALKTGKIGYLGIDVYEEEDGLFFEDHSEEILQDDTLARLMTFKNVIITCHQSFLTDTALHNIAQTTIMNLDCFERSVACTNEICI